MKYVKALTQLCLTVCMCAAHYVETEAGGINTRLKQIMQTQVQEETPYILKNNNLLVPSAGQETREVAPAPPASSYRDLFDQKHPITAA